METKSYTQIGKFSIVILVPISVFCLILLLTIGLDDLFTAVTLGFVLITFLICLLIFYKLTISLNTTHLSFELGIGLVSKKYRLSEIKSCRAVTNSALYGIGIRLIPDGWLYNVSGRKAIELTFKNRKSKIRIGTDKPEEIAAEVNKLIGTETNEIPARISGKSYNTLIISFLLVVITLPSVLILTGNREIKTTITETEFRIAGMYGLSIRYADIRQLDTISVLPGIKRRTNGFAFGKTLKGNFTLSNNARVKLFITKGAPPYICLKTDADFLYLNFRNPTKTRELFNDLNIKHK
jgi:hypothetical protein